MFKTISNKIPASVKLLFKLYFLNLLLFFFVRFLFYHINKSSDVGEVPFIEKFMAFRMGLEFDTAVFCWITYFPTLIWFLATITKKYILYAIGFYGFIVLQLIYQLVCIADIPFFTQFGAHLNRTVLLWNESPSFAVGVIFGSFGYWGYFLIYFPVIVVLIYLSKKYFTTFKLHLQNQPITKWYYSILTFIALSG